MSKELELIAESMRAVATEGAREDGQLWGAFPNTMTVHDLAEHVVSVLSERGYSIVPTAGFEFGLTTTDDPFIREGIPKDDAYRIARRHPRSRVMTRALGPWVAAAATEEETNG